MLYAHEFKVCVCIGNVPFDAVSGILEKVDMAEIRLDLAEFDESQMKAVFESHPNLIATCREGRHDDAGREKILKSAMEYGAAWVDIEDDAGGQWKKRMMAAVKESPARLILSRHYYTHTPPAGELRTIAGKMFDSGADVAKLACQVNSPAEAAAILGLYDGFEGLVAIGMGPLGVITRLAAPFLGAPFTFAAFGDNLPTAAGQIEYGEITSMIERISAYG
ncbi:MAG: type I 3-dehydroquinate dehydratase [Marinilabiliales bacterium]|nr:MAG: type I 3-dehydroquinate dehydratase [Marinilabiliales bacterium]